MGMLYPGELRDPHEWVGQNAQNILKSVENWNGWANVFKQGVPMWLHKLRNYFNIEPKFLRLLNKPLTDQWMRKIRLNGQLNDFVGERTLSGHVYSDEKSRVWYQMGPGGSIYHWGDDVENPRLEAAFTHTFRGQTGIPIFKLICPDGTGGSNETIVSQEMTLQRSADAMSSRQVMKGQSKIGEVDQTVPVEGRLITYMKHQGSYNFAETAVVGLDEHKKNDVHTHEKDPIYIDPPSRFAELKTRIFTEAILRGAGANTKSTMRNMKDIRLDFDEPPMRRSPHGVSNPH